MEPKKSKSLRVCSIHFAENDYSQCNLKRNAVPAIQNENGVKRRYYGEKIETGKFNNLFSILGQNFLNII